MNKTASHFMFTAVMSAAKQTIVTQPAMSSATFFRRGSRFSSVTRKGQATIPADLRLMADILPGDTVAFSLENGRITLEKVKAVDAVWNAGQSAMLGEWDDPAEDAYNE